MDGGAKPQPVCGKEASDLLNCVAESAYDQDKCLQLLTNLRNCVLSKKVKKFSLTEPQRLKDAGTKQT